VSEIGWSNIRVGDFSSMIPSWQIGGQNFSSQQI
jgi:hypothetical protein